MESTQSGNTSADTNAGHQVVLHRLFLSAYRVDRWESAGFLTTEDLLDGWIHLHWMKFDPPKQSVHFVLAVIYILFFLVGSFSNALVLYVILRYVQQKMFFIFNIVIV